MITKFKIYENISDLQNLKQYIILTLKNEPDSYYMLNIIEKYDDSLNVIETYYINKDSDELKINKVNDKFVLEDIKEDYIILYTTDDFDECLAQLKLTKITSKYNL